MPLVVPEISYLHHGLLSAEKQIPRLVASLRRKSCLRGSQGEGRDLNFIAELAELSNQDPGALLARLGIACGAVLDIAHPLMQDLPHQAAQSMGNGPEGLLVAQPWQQTPEHYLKMAPLRSHRRLCCL